MNETMNEWMSERMDEWISIAWIRISLYASHMKRRLTWDRVTYLATGRQGESSVKMQYGNWKMKDYITPSGELAVEEAMELLWDRLRNDDDDYGYDDGNEKVHNVNGLGWREHVSGRGCNKFQYPLRCKKNKRPSFQQYNQSQSENRYRIILYWSNHFVYKTAWRYKV